MESYMTNYKYRFMIYQKLRQAYLQEIDLPQIPIDHVNDTTFGWESKTPRITYIVVALDVCVKWS